MLKIHIQVLAEKDLIDIWLYSFENWGETQADKYHDQLSDAFVLIAANPAIGLRCDNIREGYRKYHAGRHLIMYKTSETMVHIIRILGTDMDYAGQFQQD